jgi:hypothetical protein
VAGAGGERCCSPGPEQTIDHLGGGPVLAQVGRDAAHLVLSRPLSGGIGAGANDWSVLLAQS